LVGGVFLLFFTFIFFFFVVMLFLADDRALLVGSLDGSRAQV
jgi:hypothetical protein